MAAAVLEAEAGVVRRAALEHDQRVAVGVHPGRDTRGQGAADALPVAVGGHGEGREAQDLALVVAVAQLDRARP